MRAAFIGSLLLGFGLPLAAAEAELPASQSVQESQLVRLGDGVVLPQPVFEEIMAREDGLAVIERMQMEPQPIQLGGGVVLPKAVFEEIMARDDGLAVIERMQERAREQGDFAGLPHLLVIFVSVLLFFWSAMFYYQRKHARLHRTILSMVEKGLPIPPEILRAAEEVDSGNERSQVAGIAPLAPAWASNVLWGGLLWITIGIAGGLYLYLRGNDAWPWALAAVIYGAASVVTAIGKRDAKR